MRKINILALFFFLSGFCSLLYQVVWLRMAFAVFGVITPVLSVVISVFMAGLALGSWLGGKYIGRLAAITGFSSLCFYGLTEALIGIGAFLVPDMFSLGETYLLSLGEMDSFSYLLFSGFILFLSIFPWCFFMGATFPFMMSHGKEIDPSVKTSFSLLYLANVLGAMWGTLLTAVALIELLGLSPTLFLAGCINFTIAFFSLQIGLRSPKERKTIPYKKEETSRPRKISPSGRSSVFVCSVLFATGFISMSMEVVWTRAFTPALETTIYAFAFLLTVYLLATWVGSTIYRKKLAGELWPFENIMAALAMSAFLPLALTDPRFSPNAFVILVSIFPFCTGLGYLTPMLIDQYSIGFPEHAGRGYAVNILGCILGPLFAGYFFLPNWGVKGTLIILALPLLAFMALELKSLLQTNTGRALAASALALLAYSVFFSITFEEDDFYGKGEVHRDHVATVTSYGEGMGKRLLVNGVGMTTLTPATKVMAHMGLSFLEEEPESALVICFGMGTTFRSLSSWNMDVIAVELVPSVADAFGYYFKDAENVLRNPRTRIVVDDGRRFLKRTTVIYDFITIDPPPPVEAAGSSLLYSVEFFELAKSRLKENGVLQHWFPGGEKKTLQAILRSMTKVFPHVKVFRSLEGWGFHFIGARFPINTPTPTEIISRMPKSALTDFMEWFGARRPESILSELMGGEIPVDKILNSDMDILVTDQRPFNEYYMVRRAADILRGEYAYVLN